MTIRDLADPSRRGNSAARRYRHGHGDAYQGAAAFVSSPPLRTYESGDRAVPLPARPIHATPLGPLGHIADNAHRCRRLGVTVYLLACPASRYYFLDLKLICFPQKSCIFMKTLIREPTKNTKCIADPELDLP